MPGPIKLKLGVCVSHDEYRNLIVFVADPRSVWVKTEENCNLGDFVIFFVNTISP